MLILCKTDANLNKWRRFAEFIEGEDNKELLCDWETEGVGIREWELLRRRS